MIGRDRALVEVPGTFTERGTAYDDWDELAESWTTTPGSFQPSPSAKDLVRGAVDKIAGVFYVRDRRLIPGNARLTIRGRVYGVQGDAEDWQSPTGRTTHQRVVLEAWEVRGRG